MSDFVNNIARQGCITIQKKSNWVKSTYFMSIYSSVIISLSISRHYVNEYKHVFKFPIKLLFCLCLKHKLKLKHLIKIIIIIFIC